MSADEEQLLESIRNFVPINELTANLAKRLLDRSKVLDLKKGKTLFKQGDTDSFSYYLLDGEIEFFADKQSNSIIQSGSDRARYALAQLQPRQFTAKAKTMIKYLQVERAELDRIMMVANETTSELSMGSMEVEVEEMDGADDDEDWMSAMLQSELFATMPMQNIHQLFAMLEPVEYSAGDVVIQQGDPGEDYFIISQGTCAVFRKPSPKATEVKLAELSSGDSFGEEALISDSTRNATIKMLTDGVLMRLGKDSFVNLIKNPTLSSVSFSEAEQLIEAGAKWLDVRYPNEHEESSIDDSINVPLNSLRLKADNLDTSVKYILYCDTGVRSSTGAFLLAERGFDVSYLTGGLVNNPEAVGVQTVVPKPAPTAPKPEPKPAAPAAEAKPAPSPEPEPEQVDDEEIDADVRVEMLNAELETTDFRLKQTQQQSEQDEADETKKKEHEQKLKQLEAERKKLEQEKKKAEAESQKRAAQEEARLKKLKEDNEKKMQAEKKKLEDIYNKNTKEMSKLQKLKEESEAKLATEREKLEQQAELARKQMEEAEKLKEQQQEEARKQMEEAERLRKEIEESRRQLEEQAEKKKLEEAEREKALQEKAKAKIAAERKKLAEQYERNNKEFEEAQKQKAEAEALRKAAREEAARMIEEYKKSHDQEREAERAKLEAERKKLEEEARHIRETMQQLEQAKQEAEKIKQQALKEAEELRQKQTESTGSQSLRDKLEAEIKAAELKAKEAEREIEDAMHKTKLTESAQQENEADMLRKKQEQAAIAAQISNDLQDFEQEHQDAKPSKTQMQMQAEMMKRIKEKAAAAKAQAKNKNESLIDEISKQLGRDD